MMVMKIDDGDDDDDDDDVDDDDGTSQSTWIDGLEAGPPQSVTVNPELAVREAVVRPVDGFLSGVEVDVERVVDVRNRHGRDDVEVRFVGVDSSNLEVLGKQQEVVGGWKTEIWPSVDFIIYEEHYERKKWSWIN